MTYYEFKRHYFQNLYSELEYLYYSEFIQWQNLGKKWYTFPKMKEHGQKYKKQLLAHVYAKRSFDIGDLTYK